MTNERQWVALLRGVNVGGANKVPMASLRQTAITLGWTDVRTYIASGNLLFRATGTSDVLATKLRHAVASQFGVDVPSFVIDADELARVVAACPFTPETGSHVHAFFLWSDPVLDRAMLDRWRAPSETILLVGRVAWLHAPEGIGRSKLVEKIAHVVTRTDMTARNLNTLLAIVKLIDSP